MTKEEFKDALLKLATGRRDSIDELADFFFGGAAPVEEPVPVAKKPAKPAKS